MNARIAFPCCLAVTLTTALAQRPAAAPPAAEAAVRHASTAPAPRVDVAAAVEPPAALVRREFALRNAGREITNRGELASRLTAMLTPNAGSFEYCAERQVLTVRDGAAVLDTIAAELARADAPREQIQLDVRVVSVTDPRIGTSLVPGRDLAAGDVAVLDAAQATAALRRLKGTDARIVQAPQIVALAGDRATMVVSRERAPRPTADGGVTAGLDAEAFDVAMVPTITAGGEIALLLDLRSPFATPPGGTFALSLRLASGATAVFQKTAGPDAGAIVFVTPMRIRSTPLLPR